MVRQKRNLQKGYTLVELAIVLVIIGILAASITIGRELIKDAKVKSMINDFENFKQAHYLYIKRTGQPPGLERDTNGKILYDRWGGDLYFEDLIAEGLIPGIDPDDFFVKHAYGERWYASSYRVVSVTPARPINGPQICAYQVPIWAAEQIDIKLDDGDPNTGNVLTRKGKDVIASYAAEANVGNYSFNICRAL